MSSCKDIASVLRRNGTDQVQRTDSALDPGNLQIMGFGVEDWMKFAYQFAKDVNYFKETDNSIPDGNWQDFFIAGNSLKDFLNALSGSDKLTPHLTLFICFLRLLELSTERMNELSTRHLDFYYGEVLQIEHLPETVDKVNLVFELARTFAREAVSAGTELDAGKDADGRKRIYELTEELSLNRAKVAELKNVYNAPDAPVNGSYALKGAPVANSYDGLGAAFTGTDTSWYPFAYAGSPGGRPELPNARLGFAVASRVLRLSEGSRQVVVQAVFSDPPVSINATDLVNHVSVYYTGPKGWVGPLQLATATFQLNENVGSLQAYTTGFSGQKLSLCTEIAAGSDAVVGYTRDIHGGNYTTEEPLFRFEVKTATEQGYTVYKQFSANINDLSVKVKVTGMHLLTLESDTGTLNTKKPFYPFTTNPVKGSSLSVYNPEIFEKNWKSIDVDIHWINTPDSFYDRYKAYDRIFLNTISQDWRTYITKDRQVKHALDSNVYVTEAKKQNPDWDDYNSIVYGDGYFRATKSIKADGTWSDSLGNVTLFFNPDNAAPPDFHTLFSVANSGYLPGEAGPVRLQLSQSFLQEIYPRIYTLAMASTNKKTIIPNEPYIPFADEISVSYTATEQASLFANSESVFNARTLRLFHLHPFGEAEENVYRKKQFDTNLNNCSLAPVYCKGGSLYIGLENAVQLEQVSLLIQVLEGSENPLADSFAGDQKVHWDILCNNNWKQLDTSLMLVNRTDNFLQSGLVKFRIPAGASSENTLLPPGLFWVRAKMYKSFDAVCRILAIDAQAAEAQFDNRGNELSHLEKGLPAGTISKLVNRLAFVKSVDQPFNSFGGRPAETDAQYYRRVSERLRHKNRAITLWDYEHLVLQNFPEIFKVKCLNHTCDCSFQSPGHVSIVVIPDTLNRNVFDPYQPRVSRATLNRIGNFLSRLNSLHVQTEVINPDYEEVKISLKVRFFAQYDGALYSDRLNEDIIRFLSPWAFSEREEINFGTILRRSVLIDYLENLPYVDYLQDVQIIKDGTSVQKNCEPSSPKAILVSVRRHDISTAIKSCSTPKSVTEQCQL